MPQAVVAEPLMGGPHPNLSEQARLGGGKTGRYTELVEWIDEELDAVDRHPDTHPEVMERVGTERLQRDQIDVGDRQTFGHAVGRVRRRVRNESIDCGPQHVAGYRRTS